MKESISFIHAADLHLDSPFRGLQNIPEEIFQEIQESTFTTLDNLIEQAIKHKVDFLLLVGDLYDTDNQSLKAQVRLRNAFQKLEEYNIQVFLSYGNHDYLNEHSLSVQFPNNVHMFTSETVSYLPYNRTEETIAHIYGFSYENRAVYDSKVPHYQRINEQVPYHIGLLHGSITTNTEHDMYAPFHLEELKNAHMDYWALGHIHKREVLSDAPPIIYPGNIQGRHRKEIGKKGCYFVEMNEFEVQKQFISLESIRFEQLELDLSGVEFLHNIEPLVLQSLPQLDNPGLIELIIKMNEQQYESWKQSRIDEWIDIINELTITQSPWIYIYRTSIQVPKSHEFEENSPFFTMIKKQIDEVPIQSIVDELYQNRQARKYINALSESEIEAIKQEADQFLQDAFRRG
ncbi:MULTISPECIES: DNA repair exonuclease [unclassified Oceanobacillus]|uniref:metallophosphoesterase family protein n=1 Tax=unclassified Oceanobacillus TaxID=2630292 RepID=UPI001BEC5AE4|nr:MULTISPECIES: DNA repair exonuclease [unclassified Oceanobacillus]MBT2599153.1 DNA repair exonuclease [Oceanobacillus sp. ISL-74]MBT2652071.1 DNA repair exonuclease [Oceanobacillus sp. ISL-73]